ncbi:SDR family oxidoreductase [Nocardioides aromaticivorans]|uniref:SDR family oxidoreductase n=1 Tax=Nocardioides aromaticivorans TaxID=200618 RepID=UPI001F5DF510|nr:SDR family oxidoreductase [Nocardioides aromaticivorans]
MPVAVVTGAGSGLGRVIAVALGEAGYDVALLGRTRDSLEGTASALGSGGSALVLPTDVADPAQVDAAFAAVVEAWGRVDLLVNNAGTFGPSGDVDELAVEDFAATLAVNVTGSFVCARAAFAQMKRQQPRGGRIINNGSISAHVPRPGSAAYTTSKHAITGLTKALALDGRAHDIAVG